MYGKYKKSYPLQEKTDEAAPKKTSNFNIVLACLFAVFISLFFQSTKAFMATGTLSILIIIYLLLKGVWAKMLSVVKDIDSILISKKDGRDAEDVLEKRKEFYVATVMVFLLIMGHLIYVAQVLLRIQLM